MTLIEVSNLSVRMGGRRVLHDINLTISPGEIVTIVGPNGSGKSTLLRTIIGALPPETGTIRRKPGLRIGYVPQTLHIDPTLPLTVRRFLGLPRPVSDAQAQKALDEAGARELGQRQMTGLSGGQRQQHALIGDPELLILDEPTQGLDQPGAAAFYHRIETVRAHLGCAVLMVSHELHVVMAASDRVICLNGHICCEGTPEHVASAPEYRALFGTGTGGALALYRHRHDHEHDGSVPAHEHEAKP